jgi:seryl-tRNA synthetase
MYSDYWVGFNIPSVVLEPFKNGLFDPLTTMEQNLLDIFKYRHDKFYIIGAQNNSVLRHELSHALYGYSEKYRTEINSYIQKHNTKFKKIQKYILKKGYCKEVLNDEIQALIDEVTELRQENLELQQQLLTIVQNTNNG